MVMSGPRFFRGSKSTIPQLLEGQPGFAKDTKELYIGSDLGNIQFAKQSGLDDTNALLAEKAPLAEQVKGKDNTKYKIMAGVIRNPGTGWQFIEDATHGKTNMSAISVSDSKTLQIDYGFNAARVNSLVVTPDETYAWYGMQVGASVGINAAFINATIPFSCEVLGNGTIPNIPTPLANSTSITKSGDGSSITVTHSAANPKDVPVVGLVNGGDLEPRISYTDSTVTIDCYSNFYGYISCDGTNFSVTTNNINKPTLSFNGTTGVLTVTHESVPNNYDIVLTGRGGNIPAVGSMGNTSFEVVFYDYAGNKIMSPSTSMQVVYHRGSKVKSIFPNDMRMSLRRGHVFVPVNDLAIAGTNFWIIGIMEVAG